MDFEIDISEGALAKISVLEVGLILLRILAGAFLPCSNKAMSHGGYQIMHTKLVNMASKGGSWPVNRLEIFIHLILSYSVRIFKEIV